jgi:integrase
MRNEKELYQIRIENIDWDRRIVFGPDSKTVNGIRAVPMNDRAFDILRRRSGKRREGCAFPSKRSAVGHVTTMAVKFREARKKAGLPKKLVLYCGALVPAC